jgi:ferric-dicitrate binding protein FerR (iron transport regulator)
LPNGSVVEDLGTAFNINAYTDEADIKTTLIEGVVNVITRSDAGATKQSPERNSAIIKPGEQAVATINQKLETRNTIDVTAVMAWKNGLFSFNKTDIRTMMRQASRWYDIEVKYEGNVPEDKFSGTLSRSVNLSQFLKILEYSDINATIQSRTVIIRP